MSMVSRLFDADATDREVEVEASVVKGLTDHQLLWADVTGDDEGELRRTAVLFGLEEQSLRNLLKPIGRPRLYVLTDYFETLARPEFEVIATSDSAAHFRAIADRLERAIDGVENARDLLIGSFDLYMTQTAQRTNDVMRILTIVNVVLLPAVVLAGIMGMNFKVGFFENANLFWVVLAVMVAIAAASLAVARWRRWL